jgi:transposase
VLSIAREQDVERLRQMALHLEAENARLHRRLVELTRELAEARGADRAQLELELQWLTEQLAHRNRTLFGDRSERRGGTAQARAAKDDPPRGHGPREQATLPIVEVVHGLDLADQTCPKCGGELKPWDGQTEDAEEVDVVERSFRLVRHRRQKYRCACGCIDTALGPSKLIAGGRYSVDFAVAVAVGKYVDHLPLARQVRQMKRHGLVVDTQTLWDQLNALERHLAPTYAALAAYVRDAPVIGADETTWQLMEPGKTKTWWAWGLTRPDAVVYELRGSRSGATAESVLNGFAGIVLCDGYGAYRTLTTARSDRAAPTVTLAHCWSHARRYFVDAEPHYPVATEVLDLIGAMYAADAKAHEAANNDLIELVAQRRLTVAPIVASIRAWLTGQAALPRSALGKAIDYALNLWPGLTAFLDHAAIPLDNNATERALRGLALGRKNHYGSRSERGTRVAAVFYSLLESAKLAGLEPAAYLAEATRRAIANPGTVTLPRHLVAQQPA